MDRQQGNQLWIIMQFLFDEDGGPSQKDTSSHIKKISR